jgi:hypothetical protein
LILALVGLGVGAVSTRYEHFGPSNAFLLDRWRGESCILDNAWVCTSIHNDKRALHTPNDIKAFAHYPETGIYAILVNNEWKICSGSGHPWEEGGTTLTWDQVVKSHDYQALTAEARLKAKTDYFSAFIAPGLISQSSADTAWLIRAYSEFMSYKPVSE